MEQMQWKSERIEENDFSIMLIKDDWQICLQYGSVLYVGNIYVSLLPHLGKEAGFMGVANIK